jgi:dihydrofolate reductase
MRILTVATFVSLDGVMQAPGGAREDPTGGFAFGGWNVPYWDDVMAQIMDEDRGEELVLGRHTYEAWAAHWPYLDTPVAHRFNGMVKHVASRSLTAVAWENSRLLPGDAGDAVADLKRTTGPDLLVQGSSVLVQTLLARDLVDRFVVLTFPILLGRGKRLFGDGTHPAGLELVSSRTSTTGVVISTYARGGAIPLGSWEPAEPSADELRRRERLTA